MKKSVLFSLIASVTLITSCNAPASTENGVETTTTTTTTTEETVKKVVLAENKAEVKMKVEGMVCAMGCAKYIEEEVASLEGIALSKVNFEEGAATFEYDKTTMSPEKIADFINNIHDGQYKAKIAVNETPDIDVEGSSNENEESLGSVSERIDNISLPKLFTFLLKRLR